MGQLEDLYRNRLARMQHIQKGFCGDDTEGDIFKAHNVGDVHPNHPDWVWTQLPSGKYDWRVRKGQAKSDSSASASSSSDKKQDAKITADDAAKFLSENADKWMEYQYDSLDDEKLTKKFDKIEKFVKLGKVFHWRDSEEAEVYKTKMEAKGYHCINIGEGSSTFAFALIKKDGNKSTDDKDESVSDKKSSGTSGKPDSSNSSSSAKKQDDKKDAPKKTAKGSKSAKQVYDEDFNDDLNYLLGTFGPFGAPKEAGGIKVGTVNDKGEIWVPNHNKKDGDYEGEWMSKNEIEERANRRRASSGDSKLTSEQKKAWPIGAKFTDKKGREFTITKHDSGRGRIKLSHVTDDGKKKVVFLSGYNLKTGLHPNFTTGFPEIDKKLREVYDKAHAKNGIKKSIEDDEEDVDERTDVEKVEKSDIAEALSRGDIKIKKTGKEIKDQIADIIMPALTAKLAEKENEANDLLKECGNAPTKDVCDWWTDGIKMDCGYKVYEWNETYFDENRDQRFMPTFTAADEAEKKGNKPVDRVQAEARQRYNDVVHAICNIKVDIKTCEVMTSNLADGTTYELSAKQAIVLKF